MNKTVTINLSGQVFTIDEDAYEKLKGYLDSIQARFRGTEGADEIMSDIESRLAEMFLAALGDKKNVVSMAHVENVMQVMGRPEDFAGDDEDEKQPSSGSASTGSSNTWSRTYEYRTGKKLYRDADNKVFGGVIAGLAAYFGIGDPVWLRLATVLLFFLSAGTVLLFYIIMCIIVPKAITASEKLEMRGEAINIDNIEKTIREDIEDLKRNFKNMDTPSARERARGGLSRVAHLLMDILYLFLGFLRSIFGIIFIICGVSALIALTWGFLVPGEVMNYNHNFLPYYFNNGTQETLAIIGFGLLIFIPFIGLAVGGFRLLFYNRFRGRRLGISFTGLWFLGLVLALISLAMLHKDFSYSKEVTVQVPVAVPASNFIRLAAIDNEKAHEGAYYTFIELGPFRIDGDSIYKTGNSSLKLDIRKSPGKDFYVEKRITANGYNREDANAKATRVECNVRQTDSTLYFENYMSFPAKDKLRGQEVHITVYVPEGDSVYLDKSILDIMYDVKNVTNTWDGDMLGHTWVMLPEGLTCVGCGDLKNSKAERRNAGIAHEYTTGDFTKVKISGVFDVNIHKGDKSAVSVSGADADTKEVEVNTSGNTLNITSGKNWLEFLHRARNHKIYVDITTPKLDHLTANGATEVTMKEFSGDELAVELNGATKGNLDLKVKKLSLDITGASRANLSGEATQLNSDVTGASTLDAFGFTAKNATVDASGASNAHVKVTSTLKAGASGASNVEYDGSPSVSSDASGFSSIKPRH